VHNGNGFYNSLAANALSGFIDNAGYCTTGGYSYLAFSLHKFLKIKKGIRFSLLYEQPKATKQRKTHAFVCITRICRSLDCEYRKILGICQGYKTTPNAKLTAIAYILSYPAKLPGEQLEPGEDFALPLALKNMESQFPPGFPFISPGHNEH
jgi:hypothetical protein